jgi:hypothetical protein
VLRINPENRPVGRGAGHRTQGLHRSPQVSAKGVRLGRVGRCEGPWCQAWQSQWGTRTARQTGRQQASGGYR